MAKELTKEDKARKMRAQYMREWKRNNREKQRQYEINFWARKYDEQMKGAN